MGNTVEKILILTLGTGSSILGPEGRKLINSDEKRNALEEIIKTKKFPYTSVIYRINNEKQEEETATEFVAEPLMKSFRPDKVVILGTVRSNWSSFYTKYGIGNTESIKKLFSIELEGSKDTAGDDLYEYSKIINNIYKYELTEGVFRGTETQVILTRYGLNEEELLENYRLISTLGDSFTKDKTYEIAFDITHSFRSLPIYNLVILNYFKAISEYDIKIQHVYYGNVEVRWENIDNAASIVDLIDLVDVMELTNGISEFRNTGNAITLLRLIPESEKHLKEALQEFDWATQINVFDKVDYALQSLLELPRDELGNKYADMRKMIQQVLLERFFEQSGIYISDIEDIKKLSIAEKQFAICKWYLSQNRYGQAIATAMEALRSMLVPLYLEINKKEITLEACRNEKTRKAAIDRLKVVKSFLDTESGEKSELEELLYNLEVYRTYATPIRNAFAHNLNEQIYSKKEETSDEGIDAMKYDSRSIISTFISYLNMFNQCVKEKKEEILNIYGKKIEVAKKQEVDHNRKVLIIISKEKITDYSKMLKSKEKVSIYELNPEISIEIWKDINTNDNFQKAVFLAKYLESFAFEKNKVEIVFVSSTKVSKIMKQIFYYVPLLQYMGYKVSACEKTFQNLCQIPRFLYEYDYDKILELKLDYSYQKLLNKLLRHCADSK